MPLRQHVRACQPSLSGDACQGTLILPREDAAAAGLFPGVALAVVGSDASTESGSVSLSVSLLAGAQKQALHGVLSTPSLPALPTLVPAEPVSSCRHPNSTSLLPKARSPGQEDA